jgi:hypothetical protein
MTVRTSPVMIRRSLSRSPLQRIFGIPATRPPRDPGCWVYSVGRVQIDLIRAPELRRPEGAVRLEGGELPLKLLVMRGDDGRFHAFHNRCGHGGRCLDLQAPVLQHRAIELRLPGPSGIRTGDAFDDRVPRQGSR